MPCPPSALHTLALAAAVGLSQLPGGADAQVSKTDAQCMATLQSIQPTLQSACCSTAAGCKSGVPTTCTTKCAPVWLGFTQSCQATVAAKLGELKNFRAICLHANPTSKPAGTKPSGPVTYLSVTLALKPRSIPHSAVLLHGEDRRMDRFVSSFRQDFAESLGLRTSAIIVSSAKNYPGGDKITLEIFTTSASSVAAIEQQITAQLSNPKSRLMTGVASRHMTAQSPTFKTFGSASKVGIFHVTVDNKFTAYVNGKGIGSGRNWQHTYGLRFTAPCGDGNVYAFKGVDSGGPAAAIASVTNCGKTVSTNFEWKCTSKDPGAGWASKKFDDSKWAVARSGGTNGAPPWGVRPGISRKAHWIWGGDFHNTNTVWCRHVTGDHQFDDGLSNDSDEGQVHIGADDQCSVFVNGKRVGKTTIAQWDLTERFSFKASCSSKTSYAIEVFDGAGVAGAIATISHCGEQISTIPKRWKCSSTCPKGWTGTSFDDSKWSFAQDAGVNGSPPWRKHEVSSDAHWIWGQEKTGHGIHKDFGYKHGQRRMCCRYVSDHKPINCNAARVRYTKDYLSITQCTTVGQKYCRYDGQGNQGYSSALTHFEQIGEKSGYMWHSELCNLDGSDIVLDRDCAVVKQKNGAWGSGAAKCGEVHGIAYLAVDNSYKFFVNGKKVGQGGHGWTHTDRHVFSAPCDKPTVYGVEGYDSGGIAAILGSISHCGEQLLTSTAWTCLPICAKGAKGQDAVGCSNHNSKDWMQLSTKGTKEQIEYYWPAASSAGDNGAAPWGHRPDISGEAQWIWSADPDKHNAVRCRIETNHKPIDCPAAQARYWHDYQNIAAAGSDKGGPGIEAFEHFIESGANSGTIWHSELCNSDGTNKHSYCQAKHTDKGYHYQFLDQKLPAEKAITFSVRAHNDAHIGFFTSRAKGKSAAKLGAQYEIVLSGWGGTMSVIRQSAQGKNEVTLNTKGWLDPHDYRQFWASAANGLVRLGTGNVVGLHTVLQFQDEDDIVEVNYVAVATGWGSDGNWVVCFPEKCDGVHDAVTARLVGMEVCDGCGHGCGGVCNPRDCANGLTSCPKGSKINKLAKFGHTGEGMVNPRHESGDSMTFHLAGCKAGAHSLGFAYQLAPGKRGGVTNLRTMQLSVNGIKIEPQLKFPATGGWSEEHWKEVFKRVQLQDGTNVVQLATTGTEGPNFDSLEVSEINNNNGMAVSSRGSVKITADNGYILYINGERIGAGGASQGKALGQSSYNQWWSTNSYEFIASCKIPTTFAIHAVDSGGIAAVIASFQHCGRAISTSDSWKCAPVTSITTSEKASKRRFIVGPTPMPHSQAKAYCRQKYDDLASIHNAEENRRVMLECRKKVGKLPKDYAQKGLPHGCWIGLTDQFREGRYSWTDGSPVDYMNWLPGQPDNYVMSGSKAQHGVAGDEDVVEMDLRTFTGGTGKWNDNIESGNNHAGTFITGFYPVCESSVDKPPEITYLGCFKDNSACGQRKGESQAAYQKRIGQFMTFLPNGTAIFDADAGKCRDLNGAFFQMGSKASAAHCAELCKGYEYFGMQYYSECYCSNAEAMHERAPEADCNTPCWQGGAKHPARANPFAKGPKKEFCGGGWRNSVYKIKATQHWDNPGFNDEKWPSAADLGPNGVAPWFKRPGISKYAHWIWTPDAGANGAFSTNGHTNIKDQTGSVGNTGTGEGDGNIFCRFTQPNQEINCPAAQAKYYEDHPRVKASLFPAWLHYQDVGKEKGYGWPSELCNTCSERSHSGQLNGMTTNCDVSKLSDPQHLGQCFPDHGNDQYVESHKGGMTAPAKKRPNGAFTYEEGLMCTDKCRGTHDAAVATMVGAASCHLKGDICHGGHYGLGFANYINPKGDSVTFNLHACNAGRHKVQISYALASDTPPRPLSVSVNGKIVQKSLAFPATGSWTQWGSVFTEAMLLDGKNSITLTAIVNSGPNLDSITIYPHDDFDVGSAFVEVDNSYTFYVNGKQVGKGNHWNVADVHTFTASCAEPTVYAIHGKDAEAVGKAGAGIIASIQHCGESINTDTHWKCTASDLAGKAPQLSGWNQIGYDDSTWQLATDYGSNTDTKNYWYYHTKKPALHIAPEAHWIWTTDGKEHISQTTRQQHPGSTHNDVYCRLVSKHNDVNCKAAADRYSTDYNVKIADAWEHFREKGKYMGRDWHSELCGRDCSFHSAPWNWIDATKGTDLGKISDDGSHAVKLPFPFMFFGQRKTTATIDANGFLSFSGEHHSHVAGMGAGGGATFPIPDSRLPNDFIAPYWADLNPKNAKGKIFTLHRKGDSCAHGISNGGDICCAASCDSCGGSGCEKRSGGASQCCEGPIRRARQKCSVTGGAPPCISDGESFTIEWSGLEYYKGKHGGGRYAGDPTYQGATTDANYHGEKNSFEVTLFTTGHIRFAYKDLAPNPNVWAKPSIGVENAAGSEGIQLSYGDTAFPQKQTAFTIAQTCGRSATMFSAGFFPHSKTTKDFLKWCKYEGCEYDWADAQCEDNFGGQLASIETSRDFTRLQRLIPSDGSAKKEHFMLGLHLDSSKTHWTFTDGTKPDLKFLAKHTTGGKLPVDKAKPHVVYGANTLRKMLPTTTDVNMAGFVCEYYGGPTSVGIGVARKFDSAESACKSEFGGHLFSIHNQKDYNKLVKLAAGYSGPILIGLRSNGKGAWQWTDGSPVNIKFLRSKSMDSLKGTAGTVAVFHNQGNPSKALMGMKQSTPLAYACTAWGSCAVPSTTCPANSHCNTCKTGAKPGETASCLTCKAGYTFSRGPSADCTGECQPFLDSAQRHIGSDDHSSIVWKVEAKDMRVPNHMQASLLEHWVWRNGEKTIEQCKSECLKHAECAGIEFCGKELGASSPCTKNTCVLVSSYDAHLQPLIKQKGVVIFGHHVSSGANGH